MTDPRFNGFDEVRILTPRGPVLAKVGGAGPPLLLLHGYPEACWGAVVKRMSSRTCTGVVNRIDSQPGL